MIFRVGLSLIAGLVVSGNAVPTSVVEISDTTSLPLASYREQEERIATFYAVSNYAISIAQNEATTPKQSALIDSSTMAVWPRRKRCVTKRLAVTIDLDPGFQVFDPTDPPLPAVGLAVELDRIRKAGIEIVWVSNLLEAHEEDVRMILAATQLDENRSDILVLGSTHQSKHEKLDKLNSEVCVIAMGGDRVADFEQAIEYVRDPTGPIAKALLENIESGWFLIASPIS